MDGIYFMTKKKFFVCLLMLLVPSFLVPYDFPVDTRQPLTFFGQHLFPNSETQNVPVCETGMVFSNAEIVRVSENAVNLIAIEKSNHLLSFPSVLGNAIVSQTDNGFQVIYGNLEETSLLYDKANIFRFETLGKTDINSDGTRQVLIFKIFDTTEKNKNFVNPVLFLPELADKRAPEIRALLLLSEEGQLIPISQRMTVKSGTYTLCVEAFDTIDNLDVRLSPFEIIALLNGNTIASLTFQTMAAKKGVTKMGDSVELANLYSRFPYISLGTVHLTEGTSRLSISVRDYNRNRAEQNIEINVN